MRIHDFSTSPLLTGMLRSASPFGEDLSLMTYRYCSHGPALLSARINSYATAAHKTSSMLTIDAAATPDSLRPQTPLCTLAGSSGPNRSF